MSSYLFAYGSLLTGDAPEWVQRVLFRYAGVKGEGFLRGRLYMLDGYPGAVPSMTTGDRVFGKIYRLTNVELVMRVLDRYEACFPHNPRRSEFIRTRIPVVLTPSQKCIPAWTYWYNGSTKTKQRIAAGDYVAYHRPRQ